MGRPIQYQEQRITTAVRLPESLHARLQAAATERDVSVNLLVTKAIAEFLEQLAPLDEVLATGRAAS
jgi:predicted HicB family RNase H-like nuclease